ncbi:unnamed protein product [Dimorphilus gyrociliatus]|uniref:Uncharacterized protein n=1 Tax=Dimorphilus gyrociliatus TaxID=2664684 RepID=A0A7I8VWK1_9ANNE|nr:unnamed protein product [Dimorphilus gyrociliatus]
MPKLSLWPPQLEKYNYKPKPIVCDPLNNDWVFTRKGKLYIRKVYDNITCQAVIKYTKDAEETNERKYAKVYNGRTINVYNNSPVPSDVFKVSCKAKLSNGTELNYSKLILTIKRRLDIPQKLNKTDLENKLNILIFQIDSVSKMSWYRRLNQTVQTFKHLGGIWFEKANDIGKGTIKTLLPMFTGKREWDLHKAERGVKGASHLDDFPWIWKDFKKMKYVFLYGDKNTFHYRFLGFKKPPSHHYARPWFLTFPNEITKKYCIGNETRHQILLNYIEEFWEAYRGHPKLSFVNLEEFSHGKYVDVELIDKAHSDWLLSLKSSGKLDDTLVLLMSDHGLLYMKIAEEAQMEYEGLNPYWGMLIPDSFRTKYPQLVSNLESNRDKLITPLDMHATLGQLVEILSGNSIRPIRHTKALSLFEKIPSERTCSGANIPPEYCLCVRYESISTQSRLILKMASLIEDRMNEKISDLRQVCHKLEIMKVVSVQKSTKFYMSESSETEPFYKFVIKMKKFYMVFKIIVSLKKSFYHINPTITIKHMSRLDRYAETSKCISNKYPYLAIFCYCK